MPGLYFLFFLLEGVPVDLIHPSSSFLLSLLVNSHPFPVFISLIYFLPFSYSITLAIFYFHYMVQFVQFEPNTSKGSSIKMLWHTDVLTSCKYFPTFDFINHILFSKSMAGPSDEILKVLKLNDQFAMSKPGKAEIFPPSLKSTWLMRQRS